MRCPAQFCEFRSEFLTSYLNHMCKQIACLPACLFFQTSYGRFRIFRIVVSVVSIERKKKEKKAGIECGGRCMINAVPKNHIPICNIERGMANLPLWQHLGWPSSYVWRLPLRAGRCKATSDVCGQFQPSTSAIGFDPFGGHSD